MIIKFDLEASDKECAFFALYAGPTDPDMPIIIGRFENMGKELRDDLIEKPFELTAHLLKQGFDLFGLIESGNAIDKTKIKL